MSDFPEVFLFSDGACSGNPGPGGWAFILRHHATQRELVESGGEADTTNNRMEMLAVIRGLQALKRRTSVEIVSDSQYVLRGISEWLPKWKANGWKRKAVGNHQEIKNEDLWRLLDLLLLQHDIRCQYIRGHSGHPENEKCDQLAVQAIKDLRT